MFITTISDEIGESLEEQIDILKESKIKYIEIRKINNKYLFEYTNKELKKWQTY